MSNSFAKPRLLVFIGNLRAGGKERRLVELLNYLRKRDTLEIMVVMTKNEIHYPEFIDLNIPYQILQKKRKKNDFTIFSQFYNLCRWFKPDIIHTWGRMQTFYAVPAIIGQNIRLINSQITGAPSQRPAWHIDRLIDFINFRFSSVILANSQKGFQVFKPPVNKQKLIMNGLNLARFENLPPVDKVKKEHQLMTTHTVIMLASYTPAKDYDLFLRVAQHVTSTRDDIEFIGVGGVDKDDREYKRLCHLSAANPRISFRTEIRDAEALINACSIGVLFSTNGEGTSNAILEYMALGKPVIASDGGGTPELIKSGENGHLISKETVEEISNMIMQLIDDPAKARMYGAVSQKRIQEDFSVVNMGMAFETVYKDSLTHRLSKIDLRNTIATNKA